MLMRLEREILIQDCFKFKELWCFSRKEVGNQELEKAAEILDILGRNQQLELTAAMHLILYR